MNNTFTTYWKGFYLPFLINLYILLVFCYPFELIAQKNARSLDPQKKLTQYIVDHWTTESNLPSNNVRRLLQTRDGYLWLAGYDGLVNFDGVRFGLFNKKNIPDLSVNAVYVMEEGTDGTVWFGTEGSGFFKYRNGVFKKIGLDNLFVTAIFIESPNRMWLSARNAGLFLYSPEKNIIQPVDYRELSNTTAYHIAKDKNNNLWFCTDGKGLTRLKDGKFTTFTTEDGLPSNSVLEMFFDQKGTMWVGTTQGLATWQGSKFEWVKELKKDIINKFLEDSSGNLWIASSGGLYRKNLLNNQFELYPNALETPITNVMDLLLDPEGSLWLATYRNGLFRLKDGKFTNHTYQDGLSTSSVGSLCELAPNKYLAGMNNGVINLIEENKISVFPIKTDLPDVRVFNLMRDRQKNLWVSTFNGLLKITASGQEILYNKEKGLPDNTVRISFEDSRGNIWIGTRWGGVAKMNKAGKITYFNTKNGLSSNFIMSIREDKEGKIWIGTNDAGLNVIGTYEKIKQYTTRDGLVSNLVFNTYADNQGLIWIVTNGGLSRLVGDKFTNFTSKEGLINDSPFDVIEDDFGYFWMPTSRGIIQVKKQELNDFAASKIQQIKWIDYDKNDGMKSEDCTGAAHSMKTSKGEIWVPTNGGIVAVNPRNMPLNHLKPSIRINSFTADNEFLNIHKPIIIPPDKRRFIFDYSALSLLASQKVQFKCKLVGFDKDWIDVGSSRQFTYTNLPPGEYTFRVIACNNDGVWNNEGVSLQFVKKPYFHETIWFYILLTLLFFLLIGVVFRWRIYSIQQRKRELEKQVEIKTREISNQNRILEKQRDEIIHQKRLVDKRNDNITNSINYAKRIQEAILPPMEEIRATLPESFVLFEPKDIVSDDFYWISAPLQPSNKIVIAAVDCTGHGVPGAFMSMIGNDLLNEIVNLREIIEPDRILQELHYSINKTLKQQDTFNRDGMDLVLCVFDPAKKVVEFSGAKNALYYTQDNQLHEIKGDKMPIGGYYKELENTRRFTKHTIEINQPTTFYLFSDGYQDQYGDVIHKKFSRQQIRNLLLDIHSKSMNEQKEILLSTIRKWRGKEDQIDDILVFGFRVS